jgi:hypothetical protein
MSATAGPARATAAAAAEEHQRQTVASAAGDVGVVGEINRGRGPRIASRASQEAERC